MILTAAAKYTITACNKIKFIYNSPFSLSGCMLAMEVAVFKAQFRESGKVKKIFCLDF
jgi:hypothetical protein